MTSFDVAAMYRDVKSWIACLFFCLPAVTWAQPPEGEDRWYEVEILLFAFADEAQEATEQEARGAERWPEDPGLPAVAEAIELAPAPPAVPGAVPLAGGGEMAGEGAAVEETDSVTMPAAPVVPYRRLPERALRLAAVAQRLSQADAYRPLLHWAWRQPAFPRGTPGTAVRIRWREDAALVSLENGLPGEAAPTVDERLAAPPRSEGMDTGMDARMNTGLLPPGASASGLAGAGSDGGLAGEGFSAGARAPAWLEGTLTVSVNRYLHLEADLLYDSGAPRRPGGLFGIFSAFAPEPAPHRFRLQQKRRMRSGELHYFDHPRFGLIALVTPFEYPAGTQ